MKHTVQYITLTGIIIISALVFSCSDSERRMGVLGQTSTVIINLGLPDDLAMVNPSIIDRIRRFFTKDAIAQTAPASFSTIKVRVTAADIGVIEKDFNPYGSLSLNVPAGALRQFEVIAYVASGDPSAAASFRGTATANLPAGETVSVSVIMGLNETKIVIPDPFYNILPPLTRRLIQINDMTGAGWIEKSGPDIGFFGTFRPWDVDFDNRGRIYIANNSAVTGSDVVIRINNMNDTSCITIGSGPSNAIVAVAVDRTRNYLYYASEPLFLYRSALDGTSIASLTIPPSIFSISGLAVGGDGILYITGINQSAEGTLFRYDPVTQALTGSYTGLVSPSDVEVKSLAIYITDAGDGYSNKIVQLNTDLQFVAGYGTWYYPPLIVNTNAGMFYQPRRFIGIRNDQLIIIDDAPANYDFDKLVSIRDIYGTGWTTYGTEGKGQGQFMFFYGC